MAHKVKPRITVSRDEFTFLEKFPIRNALAVCRYFGEKNQALAVRSCYKNTDCGASLAFLKDGIKITSIVEGSDAVVDTDLLVYPFTEADIARTIQYVEGEAALLWHEAND